MQFKVPQFIDIEDKLFGPLTFKQFAYLAGGGGMIFVAYKLLPFWIAIFLIIPILALSLLLTFYKLNGQSFIYYLQASIAYATKGKLYVWKQKLKKKVTETDTDGSKTSTPLIPTVSDSKLRDLAWSLDVLDVNKK